MAGRAIAVRVGDTQVLVETTSVPGTEQTSGKLDKSAAHVLGAYERAQATIVDIAASTVDMVEATAKRAARPDRLEVEFGVKFTATGDVIVAGVSAEASLLVRLVYEHAGQGKPSE